MVALKTYRPNDLKVNPFSIATDLAKPYDYDGALKEMMNWQQLTNQEATTDFNQLKAEEAQREADFNDARKAELEKRMGEGGDPSEFKMSDVEKVIGNTEGYLKLRTEERKAAQSEADRQFKLKKDISSMSVKNPEYAQQLANEMGIGDFRAPAQKGDKPDKPKAPKIELWTNGRDTVDVDVNDPAAVNTARKNGLISLGNASKAQALGIDLFAQPEEDTPKDTRGFFSMLNGDSGNKAVNPGNASAPPPGFEYTGKVDAQGRKGIRKIR